MYVFMHVYICRHTQIHGERETEIDLERDRAHSSIREGDLPMLRELHEEGSRGRENCGNPHFLARLPLPTGPSNQL